MNWQKVTLYLGLATLATVFMIFAPPETVRTVAMGAGASAFFVVLGFLVLKC